MNTGLFRKPSTCKCGGGYRYAGHRWVVIERRKLPQSSHLKCLQCSWKWWSQCKYVAKLIDHVEVSRSGMTDADILERIETGSLRVCPSACSVASKSVQGWTELKIIERESNGSTYQFVTVCSGGKKKKIALHRLVWMASHRSLVPDGFDVDHKHGKDAGNGIENLQILRASVNRSKGQPACIQDEVLF